MDDEEYKIIEEHDEPEIKDALGKLHNSLSGLQEEIRKRDQRKKMNILTDFILSDVYAIRAKYTEGETVSDEDFEDFEEAVQILEDFTNRMYSKKEESNGN